jgi:hypothetical protein
LQGALYPGVKQPRHQADHSLLSNADINVWRHTCAPTLGFDIVDSGNLPLLTVTSTQARVPRRDEVVSN